MRQKQDRWYEIIGDTLHVYDTPDPRRATGSSHTSVADWPYYRSQFRLRKVEVSRYAPEDSQQLALA